MIGDIVDDWFAFHEALRIHAIVVIHIGTGFGDVADDVGETGHADGEEARVVALFAQNLRGHDGEVIAVAGLGGEKLIGALHFGLEFEFKTRDAGH